MENLTKENNTLIIFSEKENINDNLYLDPCKNCPNNKKENRICSCSLVGPHITC